MAQYKYTDHLFKVDNEEFDKIYKPGERTAWSGIYRCQGCHREVVHTVDKPLPPQNHHTHTPSQGAIRWRLNVTDSPDPS